MIPTLILAVCLVGACSDSHRPAAPAPPPPQPTVFDPLTRRLDQAHAVQSAADANADATRKAVDAQEHGDTTP